MVTPVALDGIADAFNKAGCSSVTDDVQTDRPRGKMCRSRRNRFQRCRLITNKPNIGFTDGRDEMSQHSRTKPALTYVPGAEQVSSIIFLLPRCERPGVANLGDGMSDNCTACFAVR